MTDTTLQSRPFPDEEPDFTIGSNGPSCPHCGGTTSAVKDSRPYRADRQMTRRRRQCQTCAGRFTTYESTIAVAKMPRRLRHHLMNLRTEIDLLMAAIPEDEDLPDER